MQQDVSQGTAPATDPVSTPAPHHTHDTTPATDPTTGGGDLAAELASIKAMLAQGKPAEQPVETPTEETEKTDRPTGGLNDVKPDDIADPNIRRIATLLDVHYPMLDRQRALGRAIEYGDTALLDYNYIKDVCGEQADVIASFLEEVVEGTAQGYQAVVDEVYAEVGGAENWKNIAGVFKSKAPASIREVAKGLIDSNDIPKITQGIRLILDYAEQSGITTKPPQLIQGQGYSQGGGNALSADDFKAELAKVGSRSKDPRAYDKVVVELRQRRALGIELGL